MPDPQAVREVTALAFEKLEGGLTRVRIGFAVGDDECQDTPVPFDLMVGSLMSMLPRGAG